jgi:hypothetical protein
MEHESAEFGLLVRSGGIYRGIQGIREIAQHFLENWDAVKPELRAVLLVPEGPAMS